MRFLSLTLWLGMLLLLSGCVQSVDFPSPYDDTTMIPEGNYAQPYSNGPTELPKVNGPDSPPPAL